MTTRNPRHRAQIPAANRPGFTDGFEEGHDKAVPFGERLADRVAEIGGSWAFIGASCAFLCGWAALNAFVLAASAFDPYPFVFLNLLLSMLAALQAPVIMMSQNRQAAKDRLAASLDYEVNLKTENAVRELADKVDRLTALVESMALRDGAVDRRRRTSATPPVSLSEAA